MLPILIEIPNLWKDVPVAFRILEILAAVGFGLGWLKTRSREGSRLASFFSLATFVLVAHMILSLVIGESIPVRSFGVMVVLGFLFATRFVVRQLRPLGVEDRFVYDFGFWMLLMGIAGARLLWVALNWDDFKGNLGRIFQIWEGGLVWYGALIPTFTLGPILARKYKFPGLHLADATAVCLMLGLTIGRWGCFLVADDYGSPTDLPWGVRFYDEEALVAFDLKGVALHPAQLYMSLNAAWLFVFLEWIRRKARYAGTAFAVMIMVYATTRGLLIEPFRGDTVERNPAMARHLAVRIQLRKEADSAALRIPRGTIVEDTRNKIQGELLTDVDMPAGETEAIVFAASLKEHGEGPGARRPLWRVNKIEGVSGGVEIASDIETSAHFGGYRPDYRGWYRSHLPRPPSYVSTSQWIAILTLPAGLILLLLFRRLNHPPYLAAVAAAREEEARTG